MRTLQEWITHEKAPSPPIVHTSLRSGAVGRPQSAKSVQTESTGVFNTHL